MSKRERKKKNSKEQVEEKKRRFLLLKALSFPPTPRSSKLARASTKKVVGTGSQRRRARAPARVRGGHEKRERKKEKACVLFSSPSRGKRAGFAPFSASLCLLAFFFSCVSSSTLVLPPTKERKGARGRALIRQEKVALFEPVPPRPRTCVLFFFRVTVLFSARHQPSACLLFLFAIPSPCSTNCSLECLARLRPRVVELARLLSLLKKGRNGRGGWNR